MDHVADELLVVVAVNSWREVLLVCTHSFNELKLLLMFYFRSEETF